MRRKINSQQIIKMAGFLLVLINHDTDDNTSNAAENSKKKEKECFHPTH